MAHMLIPLLIWVSTIMASLGSPASNSEIGLVT